MKKIIVSLVVLVQFSFGLDVSENIHLLEACNKGNIEACLKFANIYYHGVYNDVYEKEYYKVAVEPYRKACEHGKGEACYSLGEMYLIQRGVTINILKGHRLWQKACDLNYSSACSGLGFFYREGMGFPENYPKALELYEKACKLSKSVHNCRDRDEMLQLLKN